MISVECPECLQQFSRQKPPKVLPCGHSICANCIFKTLQQLGFYHCRNCIQKFDPNESTPPTNHLFFDMLDKITKFNMQKEWEHGDNVEVEAATQQLSSLLRIQEQCLYTFCQRRKFQRDGMIQLYCSQECKNNHEELESML